MIGVFFSLVGLLLLLHSLQSADAAAVGINRWCGDVFLSFGVLMVVLSFGKDAHDELVD